MLSSLPFAACGDGPPTNATDGLEAHAQPSDDTSMSDSQGQDAAGPEPATPSSPARPGDDGTGICERHAAQAVPLTPRVLIVVDRSGSMAGDRWQEAIEAVDALTSEFSGFEFGLSLYPSVGEELACQGGDVVVAPGANTQALIHTHLFAEETRAIEDHGFTPTAATLVAVENAIAPAPDELQPHVVLLVTDGRPNCNLAGPEKYSADLDATYAAIDTLTADGVRTFVVGYHTEEYADVMDEMARHGETERHYAVENAETFSAAFGAIATGLTPCNFELDEVPPAAEYVRLEFDGKALPLADSAGFTLEGTRIELGSASCAIMRDGQVHTVQVTVECEPVVLL
ncbi:MAG: VWA domain-containing protein [Myxococcales bacterium]